MLTTLITVLIASLAGSLHCAGMCGPVVVMATGLDEHYVKRSHLTIAYHGGRLFIYTLLGLIAGAIGMALNASASYAGFQQVAALIAGVTMILFGMVAILRIRGYAFKHFRVPGFLTRTISKLQRYAFQVPPVLRSLLMGLLTALLPCGWLWIFLIAAAGSGHPLMGAAIMFTFCLGTMPILLVVGLSVQSITQRFRGLAPTVLAVAIILLGFYTIGGRMLIDPAALQASTAEHQHIDSDYLNTTKQTPACCEPKADDK